MARRMHGLLAVTASICGQAVLRRQPETEPECSITDEVAYAGITTKTCEMNWKHSNPFSTFASQMHEDCWKMKVYNTDKFMSSSVYQNEANGRCVLALSGYHGALAGYARGALSLVFPYDTWKMCGNEMYAPYVRLLRHHTSLANWSSIANFLGGAGTTCKGELLLTAESMGGSAGEILAACAQVGQIDQLQDKSLPSFNIQAFYTFGSPAASKYPIRNLLSKDGCFRGKRLYYESDIIAHFGGVTKNLSHTMMDSVEIFNGEKGPTFRVTPCSKTDGVRDAIHLKAAPLEAPAYQGKMDPVQHMITGYRNMVEYFQGAGFHQMLSLNLVNTTPGAYSPAVTKTMF